MVTLGKENTDLKAKIELLEREVRNSQAVIKEKETNQRRSVSSLNISGGILKHNSSAEMIQAESKGAHGETLAGMNHYSDPTTILAKPARVGGAVGIMLNEPSITSFHNHHPTIMYSMDSDRAL